MHATSQSPWRRALWTGGLWTALCTGVLLAMGCAARPARSSNAQIWIAGDVQMTRDCARRVAALDALPGTGVVNLEGPIGPPGPLSADELYNAAAVVPALVRVGVGVFGLANNHRDDRGSAGVTATGAAIEAAGALVADRGRPARWRAGNLQVQLTAGEPSDLAQMQVDLRRPADLHIASLHVVAPPSYLPAPTTRATVEALLASGADVVAVHGSHAIGAVERRGQQIIAWGLGNLAFDCRCTQEDEGLILALRIAQGRVHARVVPIRAGLMGAAVKPHPDGAGILALLRGLGSRLDPQGEVLDGGGSDAGAQPDAQ